MIYNPFNVGYAGAGGAIDSQALAGFNSWSSTATTDLMPTRMVLVSRSRQLAISSPMASAVIDRMVGGIIGTGLTYAPPEWSEYIDPEIYDYGAMATAVNKFWKLNSHLHRLDAQARQTFPQMQELACRNWLLSGDVFFVRMQRNGMSTWRAVECDRCQSPYCFATWDKYGNDECINPENGNRIVDGVELDYDSIPVAYWFLKDYIVQPLLVTREQVERIPANDDDGRPIVLHLFKPLRPDQYRGVPILADVIESLHATRSYTQAELQAAVFQSAIWGFLTSANPTYDETEALPSRDLDEKIPLEPKTESTPTGTPTMQLSADFAQQMDIRIVEDKVYPKPKTVSAGQLWHLKDGEDVKFLQSTHPNSNFDAFMKAQNGMVASAVGIPRQVLECSYDGTYASARGSVLEANRTFKTYRSYFIESFLKPVFEVFVNDFMQGKVDDPDYIATAMSIESIWQAPTALCLDPTKEIDAWTKAIQLGLVDRDEAASALYGHKATGTPENPNKTVEVEEI